MVRWSRGLVLGLGLASCGSEPFARAQLGEMCGIDEPVRLLRLEPDQISRDRPLVLGGRVLTSVLRQPSGYAPVIRAPYMPDSEFAMWSTGPCGESPQRIAEGVSSAFVSKLLPDTLIAQREEDRDYVRLDPTGREPPQVVAPIGPWTTFGVLALEGIDATQRAPDEPASLMLYPYPDALGGAAPDPVVLIDAYRSPDYPLTTASRQLQRDDIAWVTTGDGRLLRVDLVERLAELGVDAPPPAGPPGDISDEPAPAPVGAITLAQTDVRTFDVSADGRYLLWQDLRVSNDDPDEPEGAVLLQDLHTGAGVSLAQTSMFYGGSALGRVEDGVLELTLPSDVSRIYFLPGLEFVDLPPRLRLLDRPLPDGRWFMQSWRGGPIYLADLHDLASATVFFPGGQWVRREADGLLVADLPRSRDFDDYDDVGPLWFAPFDGSPPQRRADAVSRYFRNLADGRLLTVLGVDSRGLGELVLIDPETGGSHAIDHEVAAWMTRWKVIDDVVRYPVIDGDRTGIWAVRLPPRE